MSTSETRRGICPACDREYVVTAAGGMRMHLTAGHGLWRGNCEGVGQPPKAMINDPVAAARREGWAQAIEALRAEAERINPSGGSPQWAKYLQVVEFAGQQRYTEDLAAENERLRKRLEAAWDRGDEDANQKVSMFVENQRLKAEVSSLRELESAARAWRNSHDPFRGALVQDTAALIAAVDALPPTPPATESSDGETT